MAPWVSFVTAGSQARIVPPLCPPPFSAIQTANALRAGQQPACANHRCVPDSTDPVTPNEVASPSVRAQLLATEHWSLLASRSTTQNELLVRIAIFLTLVSASVVSLALVGQATDFDGRFDVFTLVLFSILLLVGTLTLLRVGNGGEEDLAYVIGMNRLRAGYTELDPGIDRYFIASRHDDERGITQTYTYFPHGSELIQPLASSMMIILVVDAVVAGVLAGLAANAVEASGAVVAIAAVAASIGYLTAGSWRFIRRYRVFRRDYNALFPHAEGDRRP